MIQNLNAERIKARLNTKSRQALDDIRVFDAATSTNDIAMVFAKDHPTKHTVFIAETQTQGRGKRNRPWVSPKNNLYCSLTWCFKKKISEITDLSMKIGKALQTGLKTYGIEQEIKIKHPNDLLCNNKKFAGILIETFTLDPTRCIAIIGFGVNVDIPENTVEIDQPWTTLSDITKSTHDRNALAAALLDAVCEVL